MSPDDASRICSETARKENTAPLSSEEEDGKTVEGLPEDYESWRGLDHDAYATVWSKFKEFFSERGYRLWDESIGRNLYTDLEDEPITCNGFKFLNPPSIKNTLLYQFRAFNGLMNACYCSRGGDKLVRVMVHKNVGQNDLDIVRSLSRSRHILAENNHILPLLDELHFGDIVFGVFPLLKGPNLSGAMHLGSLNSVDDIMHLLLQAFEGVAYLHKNGIAHRDLFLTNFIMEWYPQSGNYKMFTRPRVYIIDFETAIQFSSDEESERVTSTFPVPDRSWYERPLAPELEIPDAVYCPFRLDVWQIATDILRFKVNLPSAVEVFRSMSVEDPGKRPGIQEALDALAECVEVIPPKELMAMKMLDEDD
ncbi:kinase-like domain-containing protein [Desarmillaria tabescens]|uniref:Kinase-like domain-containing protein n=1 Tax=Armillaria tabescens TaxID=1929756 RepID=A0AA39MYZ0_ARMTA|nr:kinase-like domain-containing protein [Desarmillaria tabescens]KAK0451264.1 kinase-like domain-containing protein [Desarmillaria tabescens]